MSAKKKAAPATPRALWLGELPLTTVNLVDNPLPAAEIAWLEGILEKQGRQRTR